MNEIEKLRSDIEYAREKRAENEVKQFMLAGVVGFALLFGATVAYNYIYAEENAKEALYSARCEEIIGSIFKEDRALYTRECTKSAMGFWKSMKR